MAKLTLAQLERHLFAAVDILRGTMDAAEYRDLVLVLFFLKHVNDEFDAAREKIIEERLAAGLTRERAETLPDSCFSPDVLYVPAEARWQRLSGAEREVAGCLRLALRSLETTDTRLRGLFDHVDFDRLRGAGGRTPSSKTGERTLVTLIGHFSRLRLRTEDFEFPDMIGAAYEGLIKRFADAAGSKGGEFYTPRAVVRLMVELARPLPGQRIYDPCAGSGGMLIHAREYVDEHGGECDDLLLAGEDSNSGSWGLASMNMLFHGVRDFDLRTGDALSDPAYLGTDFDLVLSNPPFSQDYALDQVRDLPSRMPYGVTPERGRADLMFLQHMLYQVRRTSGAVFSVMPHGVLFRSGQERAVRSQLLDADLVEAVIGLAPNLFHGTGIPACVVVLRAPGGKPAYRRRQVLFINADRDFHKDNAQNTLLPEHIEKIVSTYHRFREEARFGGADAFARVVSREELAGNDDNLNIRRYVDNTPPPEPQDVHGHLAGCVPRAEIEAKSDLLKAYGIGPRDLFADRAGDPDYMDFRPAGLRPGAARLGELTQAREAELREAFDQWWTWAAGEISALAPLYGRGEAERRARLAQLRATLIDSFSDRLLRVRLLDEYALAGAVAGWWQDARNELKSLSVGGFAGVVDGWLDDVKVLLFPEADPRTGAVRKISAAERRQAYSHKVVAALAPRFLTELAHADHRKTQLDIRFKAAQETASALTMAETGNADADRLDPAPLDAVLSPVEMSRLRKERAAAALAVKQLEDSLWTPPGPDHQRPPHDLALAQQALTAETSREVVLGILRDGLAAKLEGQLLQRRRELTEAYRQWEEKYAVPLSEVETSMSRSAVRLDAFLRELGYTR